VGQIYSDEIVAKWVRIQPTLTRNDILTVGAMPFMTVPRAFTRRVIPDAYVPTLTFFLQMGMWVMLRLAQHACACRAAFSAFEGTGYSESGSRAPALNFIPYCVQQANVANEILDDAKPSS
jgi:hypothetical protein